jgi:hypothetical protein
VDDAAWTVLVSAGMPDGAIRTAAGSGPDPAAVREALRTVVGRDAPLRDRDREPLLAWLRGFRQHWPSAFASTLGDVGRDALGSLEDGPVDANRYLKLRRIAIANLAASAVRRSEPSQATRGST